MPKASEKVQYAANWLRSHSGIPEIRYEGGKIVGPSPMVFKTTTDHAMARFSQYTRELPPDGLPMVLRACRDLGPTPEDWWMKLGTGATLLGCYYDNVLLPRLENRE